MKNEELIGSLVQELTPVRRLARADVRAACWAMSAFACVCLGTIALGARHDLTTKLLDRAYLADALALIAVSGFAAWSAFRSSIPGLDARVSSRAAPLFALFGWLFLLAAEQHATAGESLSRALHSPGITCVARMAWLAAIPAASLLWMLRRAAPLERGWTGMLALLASSALAMLGTQAICAKDSAAHVLVWHAVPVLLTALVGAQLGRIMLRRN